MRGPPRLYPPTADDSLYVGSGPYVQGRGSVFGAPMAGNGIDQQYSTTPQMRPLGMWAQPGAPVSPTPFRPHSDPSYEERLNGQFPPHGWPPWGGTPTRIAPPLRASAGTFDIAGAATTALRYLVVPPDRYSPKRGGNRGPHDTQLSNLRSKFSRARAPAPRSGS